MPCRKTYFLTTSSPASLGKFAAWEVAAAGGECFGFDGVFHPDYRNCQYEVMKLLYVLKQKFDTAVPDFNKCVIIIEHPHKTIYIYIHTRFFFFKKHDFPSENKLGLLTDLLFLGSLKLLEDYYDILYTMTVIDYVWQAESVQCRTPTCRIVA